jgi:hypothetical protein
VLTAIAVVLADAKLVKRMIKQWPSFFESQKDAKRYIRKVAEMYGFVYSFVPGFAVKNVRKYVAEIIAANAIDAGLFKISRGKELAIKNMPHKEPIMPRPAAISPTTARPTTVQEKIDTPNVVTGDPLHGSTEAFTREDFKFSGTSPGICRRGQIRVSVTQRTQGVEYH